MIGMPGCVFCRIIRGEAPAVMLYEDELVAAFLDIAPVAPGHTLVVPKYHAERPEELPAEYLCAMMKAAALLAPAILEATGAEGYNLLVNAGPAAGQVVMHVHMHIIPRRRGDGLRAIHVPGERRIVSHEELRPVGEAIREALTRIKGR